MIKNSLIGFSFLLLIGTIVLVSAATMELGTNSDYEVEIYLQSGWNLIAGSIIEDGILEGSEIGLGDIEAMWYYSPLQKKYLEVYPNTDWEKITSDGQDFVITSAMWIYVSKSGTLRYSTIEDYLPLENRELKSGWNLVSMNPDMIESPEFEDLAFEDITGTCDVEKSYIFFDGNWVLFDYPEMDSTLLGRGIAIKVSGDCNLGRTNGGNISPPPALP
jgi:hypothetical protein